jgi:hypothetical protein
MLGSHETRIQVAQMQIRPLVLAVGLAEVRSLREAHSSGVTPLALDIRFARPEELTHRPGGEAQIPLDELCKLTLDVSEERQISQAVRALTRAGLEVSSDQSPVELRVTLPTGQEVPISIRMQSSQGVSGDQGGRLPRGQRLDGRQVIDATEALRRVLGISGAGPDLPLEMIDHLTPSEKLALADSLVNERGWRYEDLAEIFTADELQAMLPSREAGTGSGGIDAAAGEN